MSMQEQTSVIRALDNYGDWPLGVECAWPAMILDSADTPESPATEPPAKSQCWQHGANTAAAAQRVVIAFPFRPFAPILKGVCS